MTHTELELCARFLGDDYSANPVWHEEYFIVSRAAGRMNDADLLLALLERMREKQMAGTILEAIATWWTDKDKPLVEALVSAVARYMEAK